MVGTRTPQTPTWRGSGYIEFSDEDPVDGAVLVGVHNIKSAVLKVERDLSWTQQKEVRIKREQQKQAGPQKLETPEDQPPKGHGPTLIREQEHPGAEALKNKSVQDQDQPVSIRVKRKVPATGAGTSKSTPPQPEDTHKKYPGITQNHVGLKASWIQDGEWIEVNYGKEGTASEL